MKLSIKFTNESLLLLLNPATFEEQKGGRDLVHAEQVHAGCQVVVLAEGVAKHLVKTIITRVIMKTIRMTIKMMRM